MKFNLFVFCIVSIFLMTKQVIGYSYLNLENHPNSNLIITSGDIIHQSSIGDTSGDLTLIMIIKYELKLWKCKITYLNSDNGSTSQCMSILEGIVEY